MYQIIAKDDDLRQIYSPNDNLPDYYLISRESEIYSLFSGKKLSQSLNHSGYHVVSLNTIDGKRIQRKVHRLSMMTFNYIPGCEYLQVNHKNGNKHNNDISNLEWSIPKDNVKHAIDNNLRKDWRYENPQAKITLNDAIKIRDLIINGYNNSYIKSIIPNANDSIIYNIIHGNTWKDLFSDEDINLMKITRHPIILSDLQKHKICKFFQDNHNNFKTTKDYIIFAINSIGVEYSDSVYRLAKRLYYKYQDNHITSLYNYEYAHRLSKAKI